MKRRLLIAAVVLAFLPRPAAAQLDPLLFVKREANGLPNVILAVDTSERMQRDVDDAYRDPRVYAVDESWEASLGITGPSYRRKFVDLLHTSANGTTFSADHIEFVDSGDAAFADFDHATRLGIARLALTEAIARNSGVARFGLVRTRRSATPALCSFPGGCPTVDIVGTGADAVAQRLYAPGVDGNYAISRPQFPATANGAVASSGLDLSVSDTSNLSIVSRLNALMPFGRESAATIDSPLDLMLDDIKSHATTLLQQPNCRNTVAILVVGGGQGNTNASMAATLATQATSFLNVYGGHRVPVYVIAIAPPAADVASLQAIAANSGGQYTEITAAMLDGEDEGEVVAEFVRAVNTAVQHTFVSQSEFDVAPSVDVPIGAYAEHQVTSPIVGTVDLTSAKDITGASLPDTVITKVEGGVDTVIPQRANVLVTAGFSLPGFDGKLRAFRVYKPEADSTKPSGYKFVQDGTRLWVGCAPGTTTTGPCEPLETDARNIYTVLPDSTTLVPFTVANAAQFQPYMGSGVTVADAERIIAFVRSQPLGAIVSSTPAIMDPPSLDPPPDADYPGFAADNSGRRSMIWVGANDGMLHGIDARLGVEVWAFVPFNMLPKLGALRNGQPVGDFLFTVDGSPKVSDVKIDGTWRTYLILGQGAGGTFYQTFDVTLDDMAATVDSKSDVATSVLSYFQAPEAVALKWTFPRYSMFDTTIGTYGELSASASAEEKTIGQSWSDPAVGQIESASGRFAVLTGSGFLPYSVEQSSREGIKAGTTFYLLDVETGEVFDSRSVGSDGVAETGAAGNDCRAAGSCAALKNALQADPVATGPPDSRFITKAYVGDLDGTLWRFDIGLDDGGAPVIKDLVEIYDAGAKQPFFSSMATVNIGGSQQYLFQGGGSDLLPSTGINDQYKLFVVLDNGTSGSKKAEIALTKVDGSGEDEKVTAFPAVAGDIVFFSTTSYSPTVYCGPNTSANLYAFTFIGGPAYDTTGDGKLGKTDSTRVRTTAGARATSPFIVDQHLAFGTGANVEMFGDPEDYNNGVGQVGVRILSWREVR
ncbi:MAG: PilC/PilY family type IV pilus protein [Vicinamibacterales bacterium]